jgi:hypothetical protein
VREEMKRKACVLGAGNSAHVTAALVASLPDWECHVYAPRKDRAELWRAGIAQGGIKACYGPDDGDEVIQGAPVKVSKHADEVVPGCEILIMCLPAQAYDDNIRDAAPYVDEGAAIGTSCASNGFDWCIDETMALRSELERRKPGLKLSVVHHIFDWTLRAYGKYITDTSNLRTRFSSNKAYEGLVCPMLDSSEGGFVPDFQARYLSEDVPYNLLSVKGVAELCGVDTPTIDMILEWSQGALGKEYIKDGKVCGKDIGESFAPQRFGFTSVEDIPELAL